MLPDRVSRDSGRKDSSDWLWAAENLDRTAQRSRLVWAQQRVDLELVRCGGTSFFSLKTDELYHCCLFQEANLSCMKHYRYHFLVVQLDICSLSGRTVWHVYRPVVTVLWVFGLVPSCELLHLWTSSPQHVLGSSLPVWGCEEGLWVLWLWGRTLTVWTKEGCCCLEWKTAGPALNKPSCEEA